MADLFRNRVPLNPEDAEHYRKIEAKAEENAALPFQNEMARLGFIGQAKRMYERGGGPVDQEASLRSAMKLADQAGATGGTPEMENGLKFLAYMSSQPDSRNVYMQAALMPEHAIMHATEALSGDKSLAERGKRLAMAIPAAAFPELGYPLQPAYDRMYERLGPIGGLAADYLMPGPGETLAGMGGMAKAADKGLRQFSIPTSLVDSQGNLIRELMSTPR
jgi:hypothetical protein